MHNIQSPRTDDDAIEQVIKAKGADVAPRVTSQRIDEQIVSEHYFTAADGVSGADFGNRQKKKSSLDLLTFCVLVLKNGFTVTGESACASPENFDAEIGRSIARENAKQKIWALEGYLLKSKLAGAA